MRRLEYDPVLIGLVRRLNLPFLSEWGIATQGVTSRKVTYEVNDTSNICSSTMSRPVINCESVKGKGKTKMGFREIQEKLHEMQVNATGTTGEAIGILLSLTPATLSGLINKVQGGSYTEAAYEVMDVWAARGKKIGREHSDLIVDVLKDAAKHTAMDLAKKKNKSQH